MPIACGIELWLVQGQCTLTTVSPYLRVPPKQIDINAWVTENHPSQDKSDKPGWRVTLPKASITLKQVGQLAPENRPFSPVRQAETPPKGRVVSHCKYSVMD